MQLRTLFLYLIGNRKAILAIAHDRRALCIGAIFVLSAGFARHYDRTDLLQAPVLLLIPFAASIAAATGLWLFVCPTWYFDLEEEKPRALWPQLLAAFWMTAPLAWFYAIPVESFLTPLGATRANLILLGLVSLWRVLIMTRVVQVLVSLPFWAAFSSVMLFANLIAYVGLFFVSTALIGFMGGVSKLSPSEELLRRTYDSLMLASLFAIPVWFIGFIIKARRCESRHVTITDADVEPLTQGRWLWGLAILSIIIWAGILPFSQQKPELASRVKELLASNRTAEALSVMSAHSRSDFPPGWEPRQIYSTEQLQEVLQVLVEKPVSPWVRKLYLLRVRTMLARREMWDLSMIVDLLRRLPEGPDILNEAARSGGPNSEQLKRLREK